MITYLLFTENKDDKPPIGDGSYLNLTPCEEGFFCEGKFKDLVNSLGWEYVEVESITPISYEQS